MFLVLFGQGLKGYRLTWIKADGVQLTSLNTHAAEFSNSSIGGNPEVIQLAVGFESS